MTDKTNSQVQNPFEAFKAINAQQIQAMEKLFAEIDKLESKAVEQTNTMVTQLATMARDSVTTASRMSSAQQSAVRTDQQASRQQHRPGPRQRR